MAYLYDHPNEIGRDELELINGKVFDRYIAPIIGRDGRHFGRIWAYHDITDRRRAEEVLQRRQTELQVLFDLMPAMIWFKDTQNNMLRVNQRAAKATGMSVAEMEGKSMWEFYPQEAAKYYADDREVIQSRAPKLGIIEKLRGAGEGELWVQTDKVPVCDKAGKVMGIVVMVQDITERKQAEESLALFRILVDKSPDSIQVIDPETGRFLDVNTTDCARLGYSREEMLSLRVADIDVERDYHILWPDIVEEIKKAGFGVINGLHRRKDGSTFPVEVGARYIDLNRGYIVAMVRDISERKRLDARFRLLVESNVQGVLFWNRDGRITGANDAFLRIVNYSRQELEAGEINWAKLTPPEYTQLDQRCLEEIALKGFGTPYEKEYLLRDGSRVPILLGSASFADNPDEGVCFVVDLTEQKRAAQQIVEQAALLDKARDAIFVRDLDGTILFWNKGAERIYGWTPLEAVGRNIDGLFYTHPKQFEELNELTIKQGEWNGELQHLTRDRGEITVEARSTLIRDEEGRPKSVLGINTDITESKKIEAQFLRSQRMESIGTLAGGIAHDLNNSLAPIMMSIELLRMKFADPESQEVLATLSASAQRGADMVRQVLSFARGVEGRHMEVQVGHVIKDVEKIANDTFLKHIQVRTIIGRDLWTIMGDPTQVHQVLLNLCVNARDAMPHGGTLTLSAENIQVDEHYAGLISEVQAGSYLLLQVEDTGSGMPPGVIEKIFDPFFTTKEIGKGTGLGLSTSLAIVKSHGGFMRVYSEMGKGTKFKVYFPAQTEASAGMATETAAEMPRGNGEIILVVDDEASVRHITQQTLQAFGYRVILASDGAEALSIFARQGPEIAVVLTDMMMPVMDGPALIRVLRKLKPKLPIIGASGLSAGKNVSESDGLGTQYFLPKPYMANELLKILREILTANEVPSN